MSLEQERPPKTDGADPAAELIGRLRQQAAVAELGQRALSGADLTALLSDTAALVASTLGVEYVKILELSPGGEALLLRAGVGWRPGCVGHATVPAGRGSQAGFTLSRHEPVIVEDLRTEPRFSGPPLLVEHGVVSGLSVAIPGPERPFGVLGAHTAARRTFTQDDVNFLISIANIIASTIGRARTEEALRRNEERLRAILEAAAEGVVIVSAAGRIESVNAKTETMFGYNRLELIGEPLEILLPERLRDAHTAHRAGYFAAPRARPMGVGLELSGRRKNGSEFPLEISLSFVRTEALAVGFITDVTTRRDLERAARQAEKLASLGTLAAGLAHEINNPIGIISSRAELMLLEAESRALPEDVREDLRVLHRHAQRVSRIAHGLLSFARQSTGQSASIEVNLLVEETLLLIENQLTKEGVVVRRRLTPALPPLWGNANALQQVLLNLLTNAREALRGRGEITIETGLASEGMVRLTVRDTGPGIVPDVLHRIFDPFYTTKPEGSGLGLSISYGIVRDHQGTIDVHSAPDQGTTFVLTFPAAPPGGPG